MTLIERIKKGIISGFRTASELTSEYTRIGKLKLEIVGIKKEIEDKFLELGGKVYHYHFENDKIKLFDQADIQILLKDIQNLEHELKELEDKLKRIKELEDNL